MELGALECVCVCVCGANWTQSHTSQCGDLSGLCLAYLRVLPCVFVVKTNKSSCYKKKI